MHTKLGWFFLLLLNVFALNIATASELDYPAHISRIGQDIAKLKTKFPQLSEFSVAKNVHVDTLKIVYEYKVHSATHRGGWTAGVPNPDRDGVWLYIDIHSANSNAQIHTQPVTASICLNKKRVQFLILEGKGTKSVRDAIWTILANHGVKRCKS